MKKYIFPLCLVISISTGIILAVKGIKLPPALVVAVLAVFAFVGFLSVSVGVPRRFFSSLAVCGLHLFLGFCSYAFWAIGHYGLTIGYFLLPLLFAIMAYREQKVMISGNKNRVV